MAAQRGKEMQIFELEEIFYIDNFSSSSSFCRKTTMIKHQKRTHQVLLSTEAIGESWDAESDNADSPAGDQTWTNPSPQIEPASGSSNSNGQEHAGYLPSEAVYNRPLHFATDSMLDVNTTPCTSFVSKDSAASHPVMFSDDHSGEELTSMDGGGLSQPYCPREHPSVSLRLGIPQPTIHEIAAPESQSPSPISTVSFQSSQGLDDACSGHATTRSATSSFCESVSASDEQCNTAFAQTFADPPPAFHQSIPFTESEVAVQDAVVDFHHMVTSIQPVGWGNYYLPTDVTAISQLPPYASSLYGFYMEPKLDFVDPSMQLPSARLDSL